MKNKLSLFAWIASITVIFLTCVFYYPRWSKTGKSGTLSYDVTGYYMYLPATFIYKDLKHFSFKDTLESKEINVFTNNGHWHESGGFVFQYTCGMSLQYLPFFTVAHLWAKNDKKYKANGFSLPYQSLVYFGSMLIAFLGLYYLRRLLLLYFSDLVTALVLLSLVFGSNYLVYASINGAMTHNYLFTIYTALLLLTIRFYRKPGLLTSGLIGMFMGLAVLTRPTEILLLIVLIFWNVNLFSKPEILERLTFIKKHWKYFVFAGLISIMIGSVQLLYWKYVTGSFIVYSYGDQTFSFDNPHYYSCLFTAKAGWLVYSPLMVLSLIGFYYFMTKNPSLASSMLVFFLLFSYVVFSWDIWWYGGGLGQRALIQSYPILAFPMGYFYKSVLLRKNYVKVIASVFVIGCIYLSMWYAHMAHKGGMIFPPTVTKAYLKKVIGTWEKDRNDLKLLDTNEEYLGNRLNVKQIFNEEFEMSNELKLNATNKVYESIPIQITAKDNLWYRASVICKTLDKEWVWWKQTQLIVEFYDEDKQIKGSLIRLQRHLDNGKEAQVYIDVSVPEKKVTHLKIKINNSGTEKELEISRIFLESYQED